MSIDMDPGRHSCLLYVGTNEPRAAVMTSVQDGLGNGEQCVIVGPDQSLEGWLHEFQRYGIDARAERERGALKLLSSWGGQGSDSLNMARWLWNEIQDGLQAFDGVRYFVDIAVSISAGITCEALCHWEATINTLLEGEAVSVLCLYERNAMSLAAVNVALRTHPSVILGGTTYSNPSEESSRILEEEPQLDDLDVDAGVIEGLLSRLKEKS